jgi:hypothetical protein
VKRFAVNTLIGGAVLGGIYAVVLAVLVYDVALYALIGFLLLILLFACGLLGTAIRETWKELRG